MSRLSDFYHTRHERNRIFVSATRNIARSRIRNLRPHPLFTIVFELFHRVVPHDCEQNLSDGYVFPEEHEVLCHVSSASQCFAVAERSVSSVKEMIARARIPFELDGQGNQLRWENIRSGEDSLSVPLHGGAAQVAARVSGFAERVFREIEHDRTVSSIEIRVSLSKRTVLPTSQFWLNFRRPEDDEGVEAIQSLEMVTYGGNGETNNLICRICLEEVSRGMQVGRFPCNHMFHDDCVGKWLRIKTTCPLCRLNLITKN